MGFSGISPWSLLLILMIVIVIFGTKHIKSAFLDALNMIQSIKSHDKKNKKGKK